jgi:hypothetical protein
MLALLMIRNLRWYPNPNPFLNNERRAESLLFKNEMTNLAIVFLGTCFPDMLPSLDGIPLMDVLTIAVATYFVWIYYSKFGGGGTIERWMVYISLFCMQLQRYTSEVEVFYIAHIHLFAWFVYSFAVAYFLYVIARGRIGDALIPVNLLLYFLLGDSWSSRTMLLLFNFQYLWNLLPTIESLRIWVASTLYSGRKRA